ncbi:hypothetical protein KFE25_001901 [Diacronema lutheri]|uniref:Transmembrane protein 230 n=2 Tax=Diacronema lutheri TaxID=2081491 RepID=A0A8J6CDR4_DIALT|nr:hypothetical protein KFE25_001901 [Diacronema lutheri]
MADAREEETLNGRVLRRRSTRPWGALALAALLLAIGTTSLTVWLFIATGVLDAQWADNALPCFIVGVLGFLPGFYETRIAYAAWRGWPGYSYEMIPRLDD